ncbi:hypothetical protein ACIBL3_29410 [Kribbella sp. NPDC050124]|uniref:hypothetical protein n=1 Tax=Kribbella sp. NPDC050124 TaxID=3364114 RepID=UPI003790B62D
MFNGLGRYDEALEAARTGQTDPSAPPSSSKLPYARPSRSPSIADQCGETEDMLRQRQRGVQRRGVESNHQLARTDGEVHERRDMQAVASWVDDIVVSPVERGALPQKGLVSLSARSAVRLEEA